MLSRLDNSGGVLKRATPLKWSHCWKPFMLIAAVSLTFKNWIYKNPLSTFYSCSFDGVLHGAAHVPPPNPHHFICKESWQVMEFHRRWPRRMSRFQSWNVMRHVWVELASPLQQQQLIYFTARFNLSRVSRSRHDDSGVVFDTRLIRDLASHSGFSWLCS